jgi:hypothetical protein
VHKRVAADRVQAASAGAEKVLPVLRKKDWINPPDVKGSMRR